MNPAASTPSLTEIVTVAFRYKRALALSFLVPVIASIAIAYAITPKYEAEGRILVRTGREYMPHPDVAGATQTAPSTSMKETVDTEVQILTSRDLIRDVVRAMTVARLYPDLAASPPPGIPLEHAAVRALSQDLLVSPVKLTDVIEIELRNPNREVAEEALGILMTRFQERHVQAFSHSRSPVIEQQVSANEKLLAGLQRERAGYESAHGLFSVSEQRGQLVQQRGKDLQDLREAERHRAAAEAQLAAVAAELGRQPATIALQTTSQESPLAEDAQKRVRDLVERRQELLARGYRPDSAPLAGPTGALASVEGALARTRARDSANTTGVNPVVTGLRVQLASLGTDLAPLVGTITALQAAVESDEARLREIAQDEVALQDYDRRIADLDSTMTTVRQRLADARYLEDLDRAQVASLEIVQSPIAADKPVWPNKRLIGAAGVLLGLVASVFSLLVALTFGNHCLAVETVERLLGAPVLAVLPQARLPRRQALVPLPPAGLRQERGRA